MKKVVNNKIYDTDNAIQIFGMYISIKYKYLHLRKYLRKHGNINRMNDEVYENWKLYKTFNGNYFFIVEGIQNTENEGETHIEVMTIEEAEEIVDTYVNNFKKRDVFKMIFDEYEIA